MKCDQSNESSFIRVHFEWRRYICNKNVDGDSTHDVIKLKGT